MLPFTPTPPPWVLWSPPPCTRYTVTDLDALLKLCREKGLHSRNMQVLVGHKQGNTTGAQGGKAHEAGWVCYSEQDVKWLSHPSLRCAVPTCGPIRGKGGGQLFLDLVAPKLGAPFTKSKEMFVKLLHGKEHKGKPLEHLLQWRVVRKPPDAEDRFPQIVVQVRKPPHLDAALMLASPLFILRLCMRVRVQADQIEPAATLPTAATLTFVLGDGALDHMEVCLPAQGVALLIPRPPTHALPARPFGARTGMHRWRVRGCIDAHAQPPLLSHSPPDPTHSCPALLMLRANPAHRSDVAGFGVRIRLDSDQLAAHCRAAHTHAAHCRAAYTHDRRTHNGHAHNRHTLRLMCLWQPGLWHWGG